MVVFVGGKDTYATTTSNASDCGDNGTDYIAHASSSSTANDIFAVGINGTTANDPTLNAISKCSPYAANVSHTFTSNLKQLSSLIDDLTAAMNQTMLAGTLYDITATAPDGSSITSEVLLTFGGKVVVLSWQ